jgi:outer membrane protein OmpA-like peptidoglycan-associated protein
LSWRIACLVAPVVMALVAVVASYLRAQGAPVNATTLESIYFDAGTTDIRPSDRTVLDAHIVWLRRAGHRGLLIEGHTDEPGARALSVEVGRDRARAAAAYLVSRGVKAHRLEIQSRSGERPACTESTAACRASNRRVTFSSKAP